MLQEYPLDLMLQDRVALVTAASQGLGKAAALQLSREGARIAICSRDEASLNAAAGTIRAETGGRVLAIPTDVTNGQAVERMISRVVEEYGGLDILITNAGGRRAHVSMSLTILYGRGQ
jgi:3-oxoacyl-[acyl-carrier protein] reductase